MCFFRMRCVVEHPHHMEDKESSGNVIYIKNTSLLADHTRETHEDVDREPRTIITVEN